MIFQSTDAVLLVCASLITMGPERTLDDIASGINENLPQCCVTSIHVHDILQHLRREIPAWTRFVNLLDTDSEGFRVTLEFLDQGMLATKYIPPDEITMKGLQRTMGRIIRYAREYAISIGSIRRRSFDRARERDESGYGCDDYFHWWDHPGNIGF
jgi:hypothetical protein